MPSQSRHYGLAFSVSMQFEKQIDRYWYQWYVSDRLAVIQLRISNNSILTIINVYGPTSQRVNNNNAEQDEFYAELARLTSHYSSSSRSISSSGRRCPDVSAKLFPVLCHSACRCHRTERIRDVFLPSLSWLSSASFPGYHSLHYCLL